MNSNDDDVMPPTPTPGAGRVEPAPAVAEALEDLGQQLRDATGGVPREIEAVVARIVDLGFVISGKNLDEVASVVHPSSLWVSTSVLFVGQAESPDASFRGGMTLREVQGRGCIYVVLRPGKAELTLHASMDDLLTAWPSFRDLSRGAFRHTRLDVDPRDE